MKTKLFLIFLLGINLNAVSQGLQWAKSMGGKGYDEGASIAVDHSGNVYTAGTFTDSADFNPGTGVADTFFINSPGAFIEKLDSAGNFIWAKHFNGASELSVAVDDSENVYTTGTFYGTVDFNPGESIADTFYLSDGGNGSVFISKLDSNGNFVWARQLKSQNPNSSSYSPSLVLDPSGTVYVTGRFQGIVDFNTGTAVSDTFLLISTSNWGAGFITKIENTGNLIWAKNFEGNTTPTEIVPDQYGHVYTAGYYSGNIDFNPGIAATDTFLLHSQNDIYGFVLKLDSSGNFIWVKDFSGKYVYAKSILIDLAGNVYTDGSFTGLADFNPSTAAADTFILGKPNTLYLFISKLDSSGNFVWAKSIGKSNSVYANPSSIASDSTGNIYATGYFKGALDFNPSLALVDTFILDTYGQQDIFIVRLDSSGKFISAVNIGYSSGTGPNKVAVGTSIKIDPFGTIYTTGYFYESVDFNPGLSPADTLNLTSNGQEDVFISKMCPTPDPSGTITGTSSACPGDVAVYSINPVPNATTYTWIVPFGSTINSGQNTTTVTITFGNTSGTVTVIPGNTCATSSSGDVVIVTINPLPVITTQPAGQFIAVGSTVQFSTVTSNATATFQWQNDPGSGFVSLTNGGQYSGVTSDTLTVSNVTFSQNNTNFRCILTDGNCSDTTNAALLTVYNNPGIDELILRNGFAVYPNPSANIITIQTKTGWMNTPYFISDPTGRRVLSGNLTDKFTPVDINSLSTGIYFLTVGDNNKAPFKLLKE